MDPNFYRYYECNINCPKLKASKKLRCPECELGAVTATSLSVNSFNMNGVRHYTGSSTLSTTHTITATELPLLANRDMSGEITFYLTNDLYVNVTMAVVVKSAGVITLTQIYQRVGNFTTIDLTASGNTLILTLSPEATMTWIYRGI
jgi:hypothetical protein